MRRRSAAPGGIAKWKRNGQLAIVKARYFRKPWRSLVRVSRSELDWTGHRCITPCSFAISPHELRDTLLKKGTVRADIYVYKIIRVYRVCRESRKLIISRYTCAKTCPTDSFTVAKLYCLAPLATSSCLVDLAREIVIEPRHCNLPSAYSLTLRLPIVCCVIVETPC